mmetsp:Transcript_15321/g.29152  ORF Transcript_15321/g.29152 Transcript_15321/m.29152 type:complete len:220 (-) Transcript_15321:114-773(-)
MPTLPPSEPSLAVSLNLRGSGAWMMLILASVMKSVVVADPLNVTVIRSSTELIPTAYTNSSRFFKSPTAVITEDSISSCCLLTTSIASLSSLAESAPQCVIQPNILTSFFFPVDSSSTLFFSCAAAIISFCRASRLSRALNVAPCSPSFNACLSVSPSVDNILSAVPSGKGMSRMRFDWSVSSNFPSRAKFRRSTRVYIRLDRLSISSASWKSGGKDRA